MPRAANPDWIDWRTSDAREIVLDDLMEGRLPLDNDIVSEQEAWDEMYVSLPEFEDVVFSQFKQRLKDHRKQVTRIKEAENFFLNAFRRDKHLREEGFIPGGGLYDRHGNRIFDRSSAKPLLKEDVSDELHKTMTSEQLHASRDEYLEWDLGVFRRKLRQEISTQKWFFYLEWKRAKKLQKRGQKSIDHGEDSEEEEHSDDGEDADMLDV